jgi:hypothetical protein
MQVCSGSGWLQLSNRTLVPMGSVVASLIEKQEAPKLLQQMVGDAGIEPATPPV